MADTESGAAQPGRISKVDRSILFRFMKQGEEAKVCSLIKEVFNEFVAPDYGPDGIEEFFKFANADALAIRFRPDQFVMVAEQGEELFGIIEMVSYNHISLLFVSRRGEGIAKELIRMAIEECLKRQPDLKQITVNSSPFAERVYRRMGFEATGPKQKKNGIIFVPMTLEMGPPGGRALH